MIVPGGGISLDGTHWVRCRPGFLLPVRVLVPPIPAALPDAARRRARGGPTGVLRRDRRSAAGRPSPPISRHSGRRTGSSTPSRPSAGPEAVLAYLARYTHRVAISNSRLIGLDERGVTFGFKDYRRNGQARYRTMTLGADEFIRRFLLHVLPKGFHRIRHYGLLASATCKANIARARELIAAPVAGDGPVNRARQRRLATGAGGIIARHAPAAAVA